MHISASRETVTLPDHFLDAIAYMPEALEICIPELDRMIQAEAKQMEKIHDRGTAANELSCRLCVSSLDFGLNTNTEHNYNLTYQLLFNWMMDPT